MARWWVKISLLRETLATDVHWFKVPHSDKFGKLSSGDLMACSIPVGVIRKI